MAPRRRGRAAGRQVEPVVSRASSSFDALQINGCKDEVVGPIIRGSYTLEEKNHDRPVFRKDEKVGAKALDVMLYFWEDKESPDFSGWWFGPHIGGDEVWAFHPDISAKTPPTSGWQCPFDGPIDSSIEIVPKLVKGAQTPGRQPGTARKEIVPVLTAAEREARRMKELELMQQHEELSRRLMEERIKVAIQRQEDFERRKQQEAERKQREHHVQLLLRRALQKLRLAKPETFGDLMEEVDHLLQTEAEVLSRETRFEAEKVKHDAKRRVLKINQFNQQADQKKKQAEECQRQQQEASKKLLEQLEQLVETVETSAEMLEVKMNSIQGEGLEAPTDEELDAFSASIVAAEQEVEASYRSCTDFLRENNQAIEEVEEHNGKPGKEAAQQLLKRANVANAKRTQIASGGMSAIRELALQRHAALVEALERRSLAEALLEREYAIFKRYDSGGEDRMTISDAMHYARSEFGFEVSPKDLERLFQQLAERWDKSYAESLPFERFHDLKVAVGIAREIARDQQRQTSKQERIAMLGYTIGEMEALFDKAEAACYEAKEEADRLPELTSGATSSEFAELCRKVAEAIAAAEEQLETAKKEAEGLKQGDANGILDDHRIESVRLLSRFMKPKQQLTSAKFVLAHWEKQVAVTRAAEVQDFGKKACAALRLASPKAQGSGTELLEGLGDPEGDPFDKDYVAGFVRLRMQDEAPEELVMSWLDYLTQNNEYKEILTREELWILIRVCYKVVKSTVLTTDLSAMDSTVLATLEVGEVVELIGDDSHATEGLDLHRIRVRRLKDGQEGWVTARGNANNVFLQLGGDRLSVVKETSLTDSLSISGQDALRQLRVGEILDIMGEESIDEVSGLLRARVRAQSDGSVGWATKVGSTGTTFLRQL